MTMLKVSLSLGRAEGHACQDCLEGTPLYWMESDQIQTPDEISPTFVPVALLQAVEPQMVLDFLDSI